MKKNIFVLVMIVLMFIPISLANTDYNETGLEDSTYQLTDQRGFFNAGLSTLQVDLNTQAIGLADGTGTPLISNLDNSGLKEIIILDNGDIRIFNRTSTGINVVDSVSDSGRRVSGRKEEFK